MTAFIGDTGGITAVEIEPLTQAVLSAAVEDVEVFVRLADAFRERHEAVLSPMMRAGLNAVLLSQFVAAVPLPLPVEA